MFLGTTDVSLDAKGRVILPTKYREELGVSFYITAGFKKCAQVLSVDGFERLRDQIRQLPADKALSLQYLMIAPAVLVTPNSQGRVVIPQRIREDMGLSGELTVVGMDTRIEIWDKQEFDRFMEEQKRSSVQEALELLRL